METKSDANQPEPRRYGRGVFLATVAGGLSSLYWGKAAWSHVSHGPSGVEAAVPLLPTKGWRIYTVAATMPTFDATAWRLRIGGLVEEPQELSYEQLLTLPQASQLSVFHCATGWSVDSVRWRGVRFRELLALAKPLPGAHALQLGFLLWFGEQDTRVRFASTVILHDGLMYVSLALLTGHLYLALIHPSTRHALRGMTLGDVRVEWAAKQHSKWEQEGVRVEWRSRHHAKWKPQLANADRSRRR